MVSLQNMIDVERQKGLIQDYRETLREENKVRQEKGKVTYGRLAEKLSVGENQFLLIDNTTPGFNEATKSFKQTVFGEGFDSLIVLRKAIKSIRGDGEMVLGITNNGHTFIFPSWDMPRDITEKGQPDPGIEIITGGNTKFIIDFRKIIAPRNPGAERQGITEQNAYGLLVDMQPKEV